MTSSHRELNRRYLDNNKWGEEGLISFHFSFDYGRELSYRSYRFRILFPVANPHPTWWVGITHWGLFPSIPILMLVLAPQRT